MTAISLTQDWQLTNAAHDVSLDVAVPFDVHSALYAAKRIPDPYWRDTEVSLDWIHAAEWVIHRTFTLPDTATHTRWTLRLDYLDCITTVRVNGTVIGTTDNVFLRFDLDATEALQPGENTIEITFHSSTAHAAQATEAFPFKLPYLSDNCRIPNGNMLRKPACHAGWDWNIALMPVGAYGDIQLIATELARLDDIKVVQHHRDGAVDLSITAYAHGAGIGVTDLAVSICGHEITDAVQILPGATEHRLEITLENPELWWPVGHGAQVLHDLTVTLGTQSVQRKLGLRQSELITTPDDVGARFVIAVNGREIFMKGANWIPADALPGRITPEKTRALLQSALDANMNMIRIWGGGQYEPDWFYDMCAEMGLMVWQDFMFSCNHYPAADPQWLANVRAEAHYQIRRLSSQAAVVLWCGDNELIGALNWWPETKANRDRYLANYVMLNHTLELAVEIEAIDVPFWPSSPSSGRLDFGDAWHDDRSGDMHFWDVWHSSKDFEHYRTVRPRFCSEFGFQSFPSMTAIEKFTDPVDRNISAPVMDVHQRNVGGNSRIVETIARNFKFPDGFDAMVYYSQINQAVAMQTAVEFWRAQSPHCMGTLYWQLNDTWPVASWSGLDYGGAWKLCHYMARRFFAPVLITAQPDAETGETVVYGLCDLPGGAQNVTLALTGMGMNGVATDLGDCTVDLAYNQATELTRLTLAPGEFLHMKWCCAGAPAAESFNENTYVPGRFKHYDVPSANVTAEWDLIGEHPTVTLQTDAPAFFVTVGLGGDTRFSDGGFTLLPGVPKTLGVAGDIDPDNLPAVHHLMRPAE